MSDTDLIGAIIDGRYEIESVLGEGGMGKVYRARRLRVPGFAAIKVLLPELCRRHDAHERFRRESNAAAAIDHPNVVQVFDTGFLPDGSAYYAMELLAGESLGTTMLRAHRLPWPRLRHMALQICGALRRAHSIGIIHRDLKPENCFRVTSGEDPDFIKVLDFGIAKLVAPEFDVEAHLTNTGDMLGTTSYMAPEQVRGERVDHRIDIYALGVIMFQALTGLLPFDGSNRAQILAAILLNATPRMRDVAPHARVPEALEQLVATAIHKDPNARYPTMHALSEAIRALPPDLPLAPPPPRRTPSPFRVVDRTQAGPGGTVLSAEAQAELVAPGRTVVVVDPLAATTPTPAPAHHTNDTRDSLLPRARTHAPLAAGIGMALLLASAGAWWRAMPEPPPPQATVQPAPVVVSAPAQSMAATPAPEPVATSTTVTPQPAPVTTAPSPAARPLALTPHDVEQRVEKWRKAIEAQPPRACRFGLTREFRLTAEVHDQAASLRSATALAPDHERCREELERSLRRRLPSPRDIKGGVAKIDRIRLLLR